MLVETTRGTADDNWTFTNPRRGRIPGEANAGPGFAPKPDNQSGGGSQPDVGRVRNYPRALLRPCGVPTELVLALGPPGDESLDRVVQDYIDDFLN